MSVSPAVRNVAIIVGLAALVFVSQSAFNNASGLAFLIVRILFVVAIVLFAIRLYRQNKTSLDSMDQNKRLQIVALGIGALAGLLVAPILVPGPAGLLLAILIVGGCGYGIYRIWQAEQGSGYYLS